MANDYGNSVKEGVNELKAYLTDLYTSCPVTKVVLGGYSQGAQVMGQSLEQLTPEVRNNITFVALFGDPKLYLPEGGVQLSTPFDPPPACKDSRIASSWRRNIENCWIYSGTLGARKPYLPQDMVQKVGAWCVTGDPICGALENIHIPSYHDQYRITDGPIDQAAYEIAVRLDVEGMAANLLPDIDDSAAIPPDVIFLIDAETATIRQNHFRTVEQPLMVAIAEKVISMGGSVGMNMYGRTCGNHLSGHIGQPIEVFTEFYDYLDISPDCSLNESTWSGSTLDGTLNFTKSWFEWPPRNTQKLFVILSDSPYSKPITLASYRNVSQITGNFYIYPLVPEGARSSYANLNIDGGQTVILDDYDVNKLINGHTLHPQVKPIFDSPDYKALPGQAITFSAEKSIVYDDEIVEYQWDFGDGVTFVSTEPIAEHTYSTVFEGVARLTVLTKSGLRKSTTANVTVQEESAFKPVLDAPKNLRVHATAHDSARLTWAQNKQADRWLVTLDGIPLGYTDKSTVRITDVERQRSNTFAVYGVTTDGEVGEKAEAVLDAAQVRGGMGSVGTQNNSAANTKGSAAVAGLLTVGTTSSVQTLSLPGIVQNSPANILDTTTLPTEHRHGAATNKNSNFLWIIFIVGVLTLSGVAIRYGIKHRKN